MTFAACPWLGWVSEPTRSAPNRAAPKVNIDPADFTADITNPYSVAVLRDSPARLELARLGARCAAILVTHTHYDHYNGLRELFRTRRRIAVRMRACGVHTLEELSSYTSRVSSAAGVQTMS